MYSTEAIGKKTIESPYEKFTIQRGWTSEDDIDIDIKVPIIYFIDGTSPSRYINRVSSFSQGLDGAYFLQGNVSLRHLLLNVKPLFFVLTEICLQWR